MGHHHTRDGRGKPTGTYRVAAQLVESDENEVSILFTKTDATTAPATAICSEMKALQFNENTAGLLFRKRMMFRVVIYLEGSP